MAIDITNYQIGVALAYHRQHSLSEKSSKQHMDEIGTGAARSTTTLTALPPIPYMSQSPYHPSYAFLHHHSPEADRQRSLDRLDRTIEVADQLAQLAIDRKVKGILVRWPGDMASTVGGSEKNGHECLREVEEGHLLFQDRRDGMGDFRGDNFPIKSDGSMGYMRGRILYVLDKCCSSHGHNQSKVNSEPLLLEGARPFALHDTSHSEHNWIIRYQQNESSKSIRPLIPRGMDKFGNSLTEIDLFGRSAIFGNQPPPPQQGKFHYSSKQHYSGYRVSSQFGVGSNEVDGNGMNQHQTETFDCLHDNESRIDQIRGSLSAMHSLFDFAKENFEGEILLPQQWAAVPSGSRSTIVEHPFSEYLASEKDDSLTDDPSALISEETSLADTKVETNTIPVNTVIPPSAIKKPNRMVATLAQMPRRKLRRRDNCGA